MVDMSITTMRILIHSIAILGLWTVAPTATAQEPKIDLLTDVADDRRQVEMVWRAPDQGAGPWPAVMFIHGYQEVTLDMTFAPGAKAMLEVPPRYPLFEMFRQKGFLVAAVSQSGYGNTDGPRDYCGPFSQQAIATGIAALRRHPDVDPERVFLHGRSRGAVASSMAATRDIGIAGVILESGIYDLRSEYERHKQENIDPFLYIAVNIELEAGKTDEVFTDRSVMLTDRGIPVPSLVIHGTEDPNSSVEQALRLEKHLLEHGSEVQMAIFEGEGHGVSPEKTAPIIERFIERVTRN